MKIKYSIIEREGCEPRLSLFIGDDHYVCLKGDELAEYMRGPCIARQFEGEVDVQAKQGHGGN